MAQKETSGSMCYFGVVAECRRNGVGTLMHRLAMIDLKKRQGVMRYRGSTDVDNEPMIRVFNKNGCSGDGEYAVFRRLVR